MLNRKAFHNYEIIEKFTAGLVLFGTEVKSLSDDKASFGDSHVIIRDGEAFLLNMHIDQYDHVDVRFNHEERRERKLLLNKKELRDIESSIKEKGLTVVPLSLQRENGKYKVTIALARGKKLFDKRASIKEKDLKRQAERELK